MKKLLSFTLAALMVLVCVFSFASCGKKGKTLDEVKAAGELVVATSPDFEPFEYLEGEEVVGIEVEILKKICEKLGVTLTLKQMDFDSVLPGVTAGKFDCGMSGITVTESRQKNMLFTDPYFVAAQAIVVKAGSAVQSKADLSGKKVSAQSGTTAEEFCMGNGYEVLAFTANSDAEQALLNGNVDAWVIDDLTAAAMVKEYNEGKADSEKLVILSEAMTTEPYAFAFAFGSEDLVAEINKIQKTMLDDGTIAGIFEKFGEDYAAPASK
jgi:polar amino acid transport system substrate-binding protein